MPHTAQQAVSQGQAHGLVYVMAFDKMGKELLSQCAYLQASETSHDHLRQVIQVPGNPGGITHVPWHHGVG